MVKKIFKRSLRWIRNIISGIFWYSKDLWQYKSLLGHQGVRVPFFLFPQIFDRDPSSHTFDKHYVYMDRWTFKHLLADKPAEHIDIGSSIRFLSMATAVTKVKFVDIRPIKLDFENFECVKGNILSLPFKDNTVQSLSCLHVVEHIGLGRYGDPLDVEGTEKACKELIRILAPGGKLYFALPVGQTATYFNAHRVHSPETILEYFKDLNLVEFSAVNDQGRFIENANMEDFKNAVYGCGMFKFKKV